MCGFCHNRTSFKKYSLKRLPKYSNRFFSKSSLLMCVFRVGFFIFVCFSLKEIKDVNNFFKDSVG